MDRSYDVLDCDFVITSYGVLTSEYKDHEKNKNKKRKVVKFFDKKWHRVVLDEAHQLRNPKTKMFKAAMALTSQYRWALTGTPVQNSAEDCFSLFSFLKMAPFNDAKVFKASVQRPIKNFDMLGLRRLKTAMGAILLRRIKSNMQAELQLPDKTVEIVKLDLHDEARSAYSTMHSAAKAVFEQLREHDAVLSNYSAVLEIMLRLRQVCCSHELIPPERVAAAQAVLDRLAPASAAPTSGRSSRGKAKKAAAPKKLSLEEAQALLGQLKQQLDVVDEEIASGTTECCVCLDNIAIDDTRIIQTCSHTFCIACLDGWHRTRSAEQGSCTTCPLCRAEYSSADLVDYSTLTALTAPAVELSLEKDAPSSGSDVVTGGSGSIGSKSIKLDFLVQALGDTPADQKTVVFSSFTSFLDLAGNQLQQEGMAHLRIDGSMSIKSRVKAMHAFNVDDGPKVLLVSLRAGGTHISRHAHTLHEVAGCCQSQAEVLFRRRILALILALKCLWIGDAVCKHGFTLLEGGQQLLHQKVQRQLRNFPIAVKARPVLSQHVLDDALPVPDHQSYRFQLRGVGHPWSGSSVVLMRHKTHVVGQSSPSAFPLLHWNRGEELGCSTSIPIPLLLEHLAPGRGIALRSTGVARN